MIHFEFCHSIIDDSGQTAELLIEVDALSEEMPMWRARLGGADISGRLTPEENTNIAAEAMRLVRDAFRYNE